MVLSIVQTEDQVERGLYRRDVFGLNIFVGTNTKVDAEEDPRLVFLRTLSEQSHCSAHTGNLHDMADKPQELFGESSEEVNYVLAQTGIYGGNFYNVSDWPNFQACFFPVVEGKLWKLPMRGDGKGIVEIIEWDALALYVGAEEEILLRMQTLAKQPFPGNNEWLKQVVELYQLVIVTGGDGMYIHAYTNDPDSFDLLAPAIEQAVEAVKANLWYQQNEDRLYWEPELSLCLELPNEGQSEQC